MNRTERMLDLALKQSRLSDYRRIKIGAVISRGNKILSVGCNRKQTHTVQLRWDHAAGKKHSKGCLHAEVCAILACESDMTSSTIYVARNELNGSMGMCRPCDACFLAIVDAGITTMVFHTKTGVVKEKVCFT